MTLASTRSCAWGKGGAQTVTQGSWRDLSEREECQVWGAGMEDCSGKMLEATQSFGHPSPGANKLRGCSHEWW